MTGTSSVDASPLSLFRWDGSLILFLEVYNCIQEWETGVYRHIPFEAKVYSDKYRSLLADLNALGKETLDAFGKALFDDLT